MTTYGPAHVRRAREPAVPRPHRRRLQAGARQALPPQAARQARARAGVRGARPLRRHAADDAQHLAVPADGLGDADARLAARGRRADRLARGRASSSRRCGIAPKREGESYRLGVLHGLVFGDGSWNKQEIRSGEHLHYVQLYGERVARFSDFFDQVNFSPCLDVHPGYAGTGVVRARRQPEALAARDRRHRVHRRLRRRLARRRRRSGQGRLVAPALDRSRGARVARGVAPVAGYIAVGSGEEAIVETNFGVRSRPIRWLYLATREMFWRVMSVERAGGRGRRHVLRRRPGEARVHARRRRLHAELRGMRTGVPGRGDLPRGRAAREVGAVRQDQLRLRRRRGRREQAHGRVRDRAQRPEPSAGIEIAVSGQVHRGKRERGSEHASGGMERQARTPVRAHQGEREEARRLDEAREGDRGDAR